MTMMHHSYNFCAMHDHNISFHLPLYFSNARQTTMKEWALRQSVCVITKQTSFFSKIIQPQKGNAKGLFYKIQR